MHVSRRGHVVVCDVLTSVDAIYDEELEKNEKTLMFHLRISGRFPQIFKFSDEKIFLYIWLYKCPFFNFGLLNPSESMLNKTYKLLQTRFLLHRQNTLLQ